MAKRAMDIAVSAAALIVLAPLMAAIALLVRLESAGSPIFAQRRAGWRGKPFTMLKFRTMRTDADPYGRSPESGEDPRLTRMGKLLRETSLDELPQLLNVLLGQMSLVGPRPLYERQAAQWTPRQRRRLDARPGITGWAQATGRADLPIEEKIERDLWYVEHQSLRLDAKIIWRTFANVVRKRGDVYEKQYSREQQRERY